MLTHTTAIRNEAFRVVPPNHHRSPSAGIVQGRSSEANSLDETIRLMGAMMSYPRNAEIFGENEPADFVYKVVSGAVRTYKILSDGRRQIGGFYLPGDIFGLQSADEHVFSAEAINDVKVLVVKRCSLTALAGRDASIGKELLDLTSHELRQ